MIKYAVQVLCAGLVAADSNLFLNEVSDANLNDVNDVNLEIQWPFDHNIFDTQEQPVIGIISQTLEKYMHDDPRFSNYTSYMMAAYVQYIQAQGARVIPITYSDSHEVVLDKLSKVNGVLFPGGDGDYYDLGNFVFNEIKKMNDNGDFFPGWGTCLGYEFMIAYSTSKGNSTWGIFDLHNESLKVKFTVDPMRSRMWRPFGPTGAEEFELKNLTYNSHRYGISPDTFKSDPQLASFWNVTSVSMMPNGTEFVASMEAKEYPIFGTQFHPEKPSELWVDNPGINHSWESIQLQEMFSREFVAMARMNNHTFGNYTAYQPYDISNFHHLDTGESQGLVYVF